MPIWTDAVTNAIRRYVARTGSDVFTRQELLDAEADAIAIETRTRGITPSQTAGRILQELRDAGLLEFLERGTYRWLGDVPDAKPASPSKGVFIAAPGSAAYHQPDLRYRFSSRLLRTASRTIGNWVLYRDAGPAEGGSYYAVAKVDRIDLDPADNNMCFAWISRGSYLEFGRSVSGPVEGDALEEAWLETGADLGNRRAMQAIRLVSDDTFSRIVDLGLIEEDDLLSRTEEDEPVPGGVAEDRAVWQGPVDRTTRLVSRTVRDRQFRRRVLDVYGSRCALTGMKLINGGGRAEAEAAHIMSVEAGGPDAVNNGIALSGTVHWMFDRGLLSLSDGGDILFSRAINDLAGAQRLIYPDRKAQLPKAPAHRPHPRFLEWHRAVCFHD